MWDQYKRTFGKTQGVIAAITLGTYFYVGHMVVRSATFFVVMELAAVVGAAWGMRLKNKVDRRLGAQGCGGGAAAADAYNGNL